MQELSQVIGSETQFYDVAHERTIICWQLFAGHVVGFRPMKRKKNLHEMIIVIPNIVLNVKQYYISSFQAQGSN